MCVGRRGIGDGVGADHRVTARKKPDIAHQIACRVPFTGDARSRADVRGAGEVFDPSRLGDLVTHPGSGVAPVAIGRILDPGKAGSA